MSEPGYSSAAQSYWSCGWRGVLPIPHGSKILTIRNVSGHGAPYQSWPDIQAWIDGGFSDKEGNHYDADNANLALRLPNTVIGIDVDHYSQKRGGDTLAHAESLWGPLPSTIRSTARIDKVSGIRLFRIPAGVELQTVIRFPELGLADVEVCQFFHRYVVAWPSMHPELQQRYRWIDEEHNQVDIPRPAELPALPQRWIDGLRRTASTQITATGNASAALSALPTGPMSAKVSQHLAKSLTDLMSSGSRHDATRDNALFLIRLGTETWRGETGVAEALEQLHQAWLTEITRDRSRSRDMAESEWQRMIQGQRGHDLIASTPGQPSLEDLLGKKPALPAQPPAYDAARHTENTRAAESISVLSYDDTDDDFDFMGDGGAAVRALSGSVVTTVAPLALISADELVFAEEEGITPSRTSWGPVDLAAVLSGDLSPEVPSVLARSDGRCVFYAGRINALVGPPESAKSWVAQMACQQEMTAARSVAYLDFEDTDRGICARLKALDVSDEVLIERMYYASPDTTMGPAERDELFSGLDRINPSAIVVDGVNAAMTLLGLDLEKNRDATQFHQLILKPLALTGAAVIIIDHVTKAVESRGNYAIGAQAKRAMIDGAMIGVNCVEQFGRGRLGKLELETLKDKQGGVREISEKRGKAGKDYLGTVIVDARETGKVRMSFTFEAASVEQNGIPNGEYNLIVKMMEVSKWLKENDPDKKGIAKRRINDSVPGRYKDVAAALNNLVDLGYVKEVRSGQSHLQVWVTQYHGPEDFDQADALLFGD